MENNSEILKKFEIKINMFKKNKKSELALIIYNKTVEYTREPFFFNRLNLKKEFQSRFEIITIFLSLNLWIFRDSSQEVTQDLVDIFFRDLDACLRELGVADLSVGRKMKVLIEKFYGRLESYSKAFDILFREKKEKLLYKSIERNIYKYSENINKTEFSKMFGECIKKNLIFLKKNNQEIIKKKLFELKKNK